MPVKILYIVLGMMLTVVSATGMNIWLKKRQTRDALNLLWPALVWGTPAALVASALSYFAVAVSPTLVFWGALAVLVGLALSLNDEARIVPLYKQLLAAVIALFWLVYLVRFGSAAFSVAALQINVPLLAVAVWAIWSARRNKRKEMRMAAPSAG
ncbi:MAG: PepSY domain-containing protein, partial [Pseudomonadota bacterium]|nr:PepSY domain-containing protein [Pseudomonadota bacterium]